MALIALRIDHGSVFNYRASNRKSRGHINNWFHVEDKAPAAMLRVPHSLQSLLDCGCKLTYQVAFGHENVQALGSGRTQISVVGPPTVIVQFSGHWSVGRVTVGCRALNQIATKHRCLMDRVPPAPLQLAIDFLHVLLQAKHILEQNNLSVSKGFNEVDTESVTSVEVEACQGHVLSLPQTINLAGLRVLIDRMISRPGGRASLSNI